MQDGLDRGMDHTKLAIISNTVGSLIRSEARDCAVLRGMYWRPEVFLDEPHHEVSLSFQRHSGRSRLPSCKGCLVPVSCAVR